jgi:hypothetical protein
MRKGMVPTRSFQSISTDLSFSLDLKSPPVMNSVIMYMSSVSIQRPISWTMLGWDRPLWKSRK